MRTRAILTFQGDLTAPSTGGSASAFGCSSQAAGCLISLFLGTAVNAVGEPTGVFAPLALLFSLIPSLAVTVRRLHDIDRSGWWCLIGLIPILGFILMLVWMLSPGTRSANQFGSSPSWREPDLRHALEAGLDPELARSSESLNSPLPRDDRFDKLERLAKLRDTGLLSDDELQKHSQSMSLLSAFVCIYTFERRPTRFALISPACRMVRVISLSC